MAEFVSFSPQQIDKIGLICTNCGSETVIDITNERANQPRQCPACRGAGGPEIPVFQQPAQPPFQYDGNFSWLEDARRVRRSNGAGEVRFYFRERE